MYREYTVQRDTAGERDHSRMYREYTQCGEILHIPERHHSRMYREYTQCGEMLHTRETP